MNSKTPDEKKINSELKTFGKNIKYLREARNLSLEALSLKTNISVKTLTDMENGADFEAQFMVFLCDFYGVAPSKLFSASFIRESFE